MPPIARHPAQGRGILGTVRPSSMGCTLTRRHGSRACREAITPAFGSAAASGLSWLLPCPCRSPDTRPLPPSGPPFRVIVGEFARPWGAAKHARALSHGLVRCGLLSGRPPRLACLPSSRYTLARRASFRSSPRIVSCLFRVCRSPVRRAVRHPLPRIYRPCPLPPPLPKKPISSGPLPTS